MSNLEDLNAKRDLLNAIPLENVLEPTIPVDVYLQEAENQFHWALDDLAELGNVGITEEMLNDLPVRAGALRETQSLWNKDRFSQQEAQREWSERSPLAYDLRDELLHTFRYAYRGDSAILGRVAAIADGSGHADMIQDLNDLSVLGKSQPDALNAIGYDVDRLDQAATLADDMANLLATANGDKADQNESKLLRDRAYTHLKELVDQVRDAGKYLFWRNERRLKGYISQYWKKQKRQKPDEEPETPVE